MEHMQLIIMSLPWVPTMLASWRMSLYALFLSVVLKVTYLDHPTVHHEVTAREREERVRDPSHLRPPLRPTTRPPNRIYPHASNRVPRRGLGRPSPRTRSTTSRPSTMATKRRHRA